MILTRRSILAGFAALVAAPAIVRAGTLMPVKVWKPTHLGTLAGYERMIVRGQDIFGNAMVETYLIGRDGVHTRTSPEAAYVDRISSVTLMGVEGGGCERMFGADFATRYPTRARDLRGAQLGIGYPTLFFGPGDS